MSSSVGVRRFATVVTATNAALTVECGFRPVSVRVQNNSNQVMAEWSDNLADAYAYKTIADGTRSAVTSAGITPTSTGFTLGALADVNDTTTELLHVEAWG